MATKTVVRAAIVAALYIVLTIALAPMSFGLLQFRVSEMLKPLALFHPGYALAFVIGTFFSNLASPFGAWDFVCMAVVDGLAALVCWKLRKRQVASLIIQAVIISVGVAVFPLGFGGGLPVLISFISVLIPQLIILLGSYFIIWRYFGEWLA